VQDRDFAFLGCCSIVMPRLLLALPALVAVLLAAGPAPARADCPGVDSDCPYTAVTPSGQRGGGVLRFPQAVAVGPDGNVYVGDQGSHLIGVFAPDGTPLRDIGTPGVRPGELSAVGAVAVGGDGTVHVADGGSNRIVRFSSGGDLLGSFGGPGTDVGRFHFGAGGGNDAAAGGGLAVAGDVLYAVDTGNDRVVRFDTTGGHGAEIVPPGTLANPRGVAVRGTRMLVADDQNHRVAAFDTGGHLLSSVGLGRGAGPGQLNFPYGVALDRQGRVFVADDLNQRIVRFSTPATGYRYKARWGSYGTGPGQLAYPRGIATAADGTLYVANTGNDRIDAFDASGQLLRSFGSSGRASGQFDDPLGVAADASGFRAVTDAVNGRVQVLRPDGSVATVWGSPNPGPTLLPDPVAVAFDAGGNGYVLDGRRAHILVFDRATATTSRTIGSPGSGFGQMLEPSALAIDGSGRISVADAGNDRIVRFAQDGTPLGSFPTENAPRGIATTGDGSRTYVADSANRITVYDADGAQLDQFGGTGTKLGKLNAPAGLALDAAGNLWVADRGNNRVQQFGPDGARLARFGARGTGPGELIHPTGVSVDCNGVVTVTDSDNNRVQSFTLAAPTPGVTCTPLPDPAAPPALKVPTLPEPLGPQITARALRTSGLLTARTLPVRVGCDTTCTLTASVTVTQRSTPPKGRQAVSIAAKVPGQVIPAGTSRIVRFTLAPKDVKQLRKALKGHRGLDVVLQLDATATAGQPTTQTTRLSATA
jgi:tripartite motif-containing protein 71